MFGITTNFIHNLEKTTTVLEVMEVVNNFLQTIVTIEIAYWKNTNKWNCEWHTDNFIISQNPTNYESYLNECMSLQSIEKITLNNEFRVLLFIPLLFHQQSLGVIVVSYDIDKKELGQDVKIILLLVASLVASYLYQIENKQSNNLAQTTKNSQSNIDFTGLKILLVEDVISYQIIIGKFLKNLGILPTVTATGNEALLQLQTNKFDLVLLDIQLPDIDGLSVAEKARKELNFTNPIIAMTADNGDDILEKITKVGMNSIITKPVQQATLYKLLQNYAVKPKKQPDLSFLEQAANNNDNFIKMMLKMTVTEFQQFEKLFAIAVENKNINEMVLLKHKIKPHIESYKLEELKNIIDEIFLNVGNADKIQILLANLQTEIREICMFFAKKLS